MRLNKISLENFRCFRKQEVDLSADVIALYGRNGTGKTALFDAIEYCLTGAIGRFQSDSSESDSRYLVNAFAGTGTKVRLELGNDNSHWISSELEGSSWNVKGSDGSRSRKEFFFSELVDDAYLPARKEFDPLIELFRTTVLLSQASMRHFIEASAEQRSGLVSNLVGAAYLQRCLDKSRGVIAEGKKRLRRAESDIALASPQNSALQSSITEVEGKLTGFDVSYRSLVSEENLFSAFSALNQDVAAREQLRDHDRDNLSVVFTSFCETSLSQIREKIRSIDALSVLMPQHLERLQNRDVLDERLRTARNSLALASTAERGAIDRLISEQVSASQLRIAGDVIEQEYNQCLQLAGLLTKRVANEEAQTVCRVRMADLTERMDSVKRENDALETLLRTAQSENASKSSELTALNERLQELSRLREDYAQYSVGRDQIELLRSSQQSIQQNLENLNRSRSELLTEYSELQQSSNRLTQEAVDAAASNAELAEAILKLRGHSTEGICALCGHQHDSQRALQEAIDARLAGTSLITQRLQVEVRRIQERQESIQQRTRALETEIVALNRERDDSTRKIDRTSEANRSFESRALNLGQSLELASIEETLDAQVVVVGAARTDVIQRQDSLRELTGQFSSVRDQLTSSTNQLLSEKSKLEDLIRINAGIDQEIAAAGALTLSLDSKTQTLRDRLGSSRASLAAQSSSIDALEREIATLKSRRTDLEGTLASEEQSLLSLTRLIDGVKERLRSLNLEETTSSEPLATLRIEVMQHETQVLEFAELVRNYIAQRGREALEAEISRLREEHARSNATLESFKKIHDEIQSAIATAETWELSLTRLVQESVAQRLNQHRVESFRLFQSMIPTPYLFEDITVSQTDAAVRLGLRYRGLRNVVGEPKYFLSSAQANVLGLSYFLSFARRQRWCKLRTILMDDPVQHLDDLDAVAFLDVIRSLVVSDSVPRQQVVISTCDFNLYQLMIRKFSNLASEKLRFTALSFRDASTEGPTLRYDYTGNITSAAA